MSEVLENSFESWNEDYQRRMDRIEKEKTSETVYVRSEHDKVDREEVGERSAHQCDPVRSEHDKVDREEVGERSAHQCDPPRERRRIFAYVWTFFCLLLLVGVALGFIDLETVEKLKPILTALSNRNVTIKI